jgi:polysaccharide pyruvyl transferase WcaK-like protein
MRPVPKSIALFGLFGVGNLGNDASLFAMLRYLREVFPDATISSICGNPAKVTEDYGIPAVSIYPVRGDRRPCSKNLLVELLYKLFVRLPEEVAIWLRTLTYLRNIDMMIVPGTGILDDMGLSSCAFAYGLFKWCVSAKLGGAKVLFISIGAGPIMSRLSRLLMTSAARVADYRSYRDKVSKDYMTGIGFDAHDDPVYPDLVFSLPTLEAAHNRQARAEPLIIGVGVMAYRWWKNQAGSFDEIYRNYIEKLAAFVEWLLDQQYQIRLVIGEMGDQCAVDDLLTRIPANLIDSGKARIVSEPINSIDDVLRQVAETDIVVATRFHNVICALMLNKPVVSLGYARKFDDLMGEMGLTNYCQHIERLNVDQLIEQFSDLTRDYQRLRQLISEKNLQYREDLRRQFFNIFSQTA